MDSSIYLMSQIILVVGLICLLYRIFAGNSRQIFIIYINKRFYVGQSNAMAFENKDITETFKEFGSLYDQIYSITQRMIKDKHLTNNQLLQAESLVAKMNEHNCDFRIYHLKDAIEHAIWCEKYSREKRAKISV